MNVVRIPDGSIGLAWNNGKVEILLPGVHVRNSTLFSFSGPDAICRMDQELISIGPIKIFTVRSGSTRVCFDSGKVHIFGEGRFAINSNTFSVGPSVNTQQQNFRFSRHLVLLDGGVSMFVMGLLTFQVANVEKLIYQLGPENITRSVEDITKAELSRVFSALHLEQISSPGGEDDGQGAAAKPQDSIRVRICEKVKEYITPIIGAWGLTVNSFQLESTTLADAKYAAEYEQASLQMAKAKSNLRAQDSQNKIMLQTAQVRS